MAVANESTSSVNSENGQQHDAKYDINAVLPPFVTRSIGNLRVQNFTIETIKRPEGKIEFIYKLLLKDASKSDASKSLKTSKSKSRKSLPLTNMSEDSLIKSTDSASTLLKTPNVIDMVNVHVVLIHYAPCVLIDENQKVELPSNLKRRKATTTFTHEFKSNTTVREVLNEFFDEFQRRVDGVFSPELSYAKSRSQTKLQKITDKIMDTKIGSLAKDRDNFTVYVNTIKKEKK
ncbi:unnamed protein product [Caenorhabditis bovis]|uniref:Uncharacterized protein n=1 Tax=Caenorhabditis bovis TaxID=2654633 RepID=A0A8S1F962_9PELO|nr:unnamed protein product [Caenorhabditis bovis]